MKLVRAISSCAIVWASTNRRSYYKNYIDKHIVPNIGKIKLSKLTTLDLQKFYNKAKTKGREYCPRRWHAF